MVKFGSVGSSRKQKTKNQIHNIKILYSMKKEEKPAIAFYYLYLVQFGASACIICKKNII